MQNDKTQYINEDINTYIHGYTTQAHTHTYRKRNKSKPKWERHAYIEMIVWIENQKVKHKTENDPSAPKCMESELEIKKNTNKTE